MAANRLYVYQKWLKIAGNLPMYAPHTVCNQQVRGSSPFTSSSGTGPVPKNRAHRLYKIAYLYGGVPEWPKGADCKSVVDDFSGSNPLSPTIDKALHKNARFLFCLYKLSWRSSSVRNCISKWILRIEFQLIFFASSAVALSAFCPDPHRDPHAEINGNGWILPGRKFQPLFACWGCFT